MIIKVETNGSTHIQIEGANFPPLLQLKNLIITPENKEGCFAVTWLNGCDISQSSLLKG
jgi:hypothetical protein